MAVIFAFVLVLWACGRFELFAICTGHGNASKIDFRFDGYFDVAAYPRMIENLKTPFLGRLGGCGLHNFLDFCIAQPVQKSYWTEPRGACQIMEF